MENYDKNLLEEINLQALFNLFMYLPCHQSENKSLSLKEQLSFFKEDAGDDDSQKNLLRYETIKNAVNNNALFASSRILDCSLSSSGMSACVFYTDKGNTGKATYSFVFKGTGNGEWQDNGEGLSGLHTQNTYIKYAKGAKVLSSRTVFPDYATARQAQALNWFDLVFSKYCKPDSARVIVSGHSKGGNKAQFIAINSHVADICFGFNSQGFSPEAVAQMKKRKSFESNRRKIFTISCDNDYVNVLGERISSKENTLYVKSRNYLHLMEGMLDKNGNLNPISEQGKLSRYVQSLSDDLMKIPPEIRKYATVGVMNIFSYHYSRKDTFDSEDDFCQSTISAIASGEKEVLNYLKCSEHA